MKALKFLLRGKTAFFKQPDVNTYCYYTYGCIHKVALLGIFGAVMGYGGYNHQDKNQTYPEFYEKLKDLKISICPLNEKGYIPKKVQTFNNSVGYASKEEGGNLIVKEQWLENPSWEIAFLIEDAVSEALAERLVNFRFTFIPYLGKNDHAAQIEQVEVVEASPLSDRENLKISSLFPSEAGSLQSVKGARALMQQQEAPFKYEERLPVSLEPVCNQYETRPMTFTNQRVTLGASILAFTLGDKNYAFI